MSTKSIRSLAAVLILSAVGPAGVGNPARTAAQEPAASAPTFQAYSKFDFVPGEKIVALDDFTSGPRRPPPHEPPPKPG